MILIWIISLSVVFVEASQAHQPVISPFSAPKDVEEGQKVSFTCTIRKGEPPFTFKWFKNNKPIDSQDNLLIRNQEDFSIITISDVQMKDRGNFTCLVENGYGISSHSAKLVINGILKLVLKK